MCILTVARVKEKEKREKDSGWAQLECAEGTHFSPPASIVLQVHKLYLGTQYGQVTIHLCVSCVYARQKSVLYDVAIEESFD